MIELSIYVVNVIFQVPRRVRLTAWSGVYAGKLVYDSLGLAGTLLPRAGSPASPPSTPARGNHARLRIPRPRREVPPPTHILRARKRSPRRGARTRLHHGCHNERQHAPRQPQPREEKLKAPPPSPQEDEDNEDTEPVAATITLHYGPTLYRFHGAIVSYPSPWRLVASIARRPSTTTGLDYRPLAARLQPYSHA